MKIHENKLVYYVQLYNIESYNSNVKNLIFIKKRIYRSAFFLTVEICKCYYILVLESLQVRLRTMSAVCYNNNIQFYCVINNYLYFF